MNTLRAIYVIWYRDLIRFWRDRARLVASLAQPLLYLLIFGTGLSSALSGASGAFGGSGSTGGLTYVQFIFPGIIGMAVLFSAYGTASSASSRRCWSRPSIARRSRSARRSAAPPRR
jgi:ABC-2 type transport system permease protein